MKASKQRLVYSTDTGRMCPDCNQAQTACQCKSNAKNALTKQGDGIVRIQRESKGRKGKGVTLITGLPVSGGELNKIAKELKQLCGCGGAVKNGIIEIQGDSRDKLKADLEKRGFTVKLAGG
jgi:translation initiation factor 1